MVHEFHIPDVLRGCEVRRITWDDETGAVEGDHSYVQLLRDRIAEAPVTMHEIGGSLSLDDPGHSAPDFLALVFFECYSPGLKNHIPASLADVQMTLRDVPPLPEGSFA